MRIACPVHISVLGVIIPIISNEEYKLRSSAVCSFIRLPVAVFLLGTVYPHSINLCYLCSSLNVKGEVSHPYRTASKIIVIYFNLYIFAVDGKVTHSELDGSKHWDFAMKFSRTISL
jgi:hypothetical protein